MRRYGVGIIGLGGMGQEMAEAMTAHPRFKPVAGFDPQMTRKPAFPIHDSAERVIANPAVNLVYVASPPAHHEAAVLLTAQAGKALLCEKPLAATPQAAYACLAAVETAGIPSAVNFYFAAAPAARKLTALVRAGELGEITQAHLTLRFRRWPRDWQGQAGAWLSSAAEGGFMREVGSHFIFLAQRLFAPAGIGGQAGSGGRARIGSVAVTRGEAGTETSLRAELQFPQVTLQIDGAVSGPDEDRNRFELTGSKGRAAIVDWSDLERDGKPVDLTDVAERPLDFLADLLDGKPHPLASFEEAASVVETVETLLL